MGCPNAQLSAALAASGVDSPCRSDVAEIVFSPRPQPLLSLVLDLICRMYYVFRLGIQARCAFAESMGEVFEESKEKPNGRTGVLCERENHR